MPDEIIGSWSEIKQEIVRQYAERYALILESATRRRGGIKGSAYIDAFASTGTAVRRATGESIPGSVRNALDVDPAFNEYYFIDKDPAAVRRLRELTAGRPDVHVFEGDSNEVLLSEVFPRFSYERRWRALCFLDPRDIGIDWDVVVRAGQMGSIELFITFMIMDINRNLLLRAGPQLDPAERRRMRRFWGDESWDTLVYTETGIQSDLFGDEHQRYSRHQPSAVVQEYRRRLRDIAGFEHVPEPIPMRNETNADIYWLFFASNNEVGAKIADHILRSHDPNIPRTGSLF